MNFGSLMGGFSGMIGLLTIVPFLLVGLGLFFWGMRGQRGGNESKSWPTTTGRILMSQIESRRSRSGSSGYSTTFYPQIMYEYDLGGQRFQSNQINRGVMLSYGMTSMAQQKTMQYPVGSNVLVYYNPMNPSESVLETGASGGSKILMGIGLMIFLFAACMGLSMTVFSTFIGQFINQVTSAVTK
jgi:hypothetical protein